MLLRSYISKQAVLIRDSYSNTSRNPIIELSYGGDTNSATTKVSRYVFKIDLDNIQNQLNKNVFKNESIQSHTLNFTNCIYNQNDYIGQNFITSKRANGFTLVLASLPESFDEGTGSDYIYYRFNSNTLVNNNSAANWFQNTQTSNWEFPGVFSGTSDDIPLSAIVTTQYFEIGNENISMDITNYINEILFSGRTNNGLCLFFSANTETQTTNVPVVTTFFSKYTSTFFEPFLETKYNTYMNDSLCCLKFDTENNFYFNSNTQINEIQSFEIIDSNNDTILAITSNTAFTHVNFYNYFVNVTIDDNPEYNDIENFTAKWTILVNNKIKIFNKDFTLTRINEIEDKLEYENEVYINVVGIKSNDKISKKTGLTKLLFKGKRLLKNKLLNNLIDDIEFRIYIMQGTNEIDIIPFTKVSKINNEYFVDIDFSWFISHDYYIQTRAINKNGIQYSNTLTTKFRIVN
jgi:hypothetical protein